MKILLKQFVELNEAHFHLGRYVKKIIIEKSLYPQCVTVWCSFWAGGIIGSYFFGNKTGAAVSVNGLRYRNVIDEFSWLLTSRQLDRKFPTFPG